MTAIPVTAEEVAVTFVADMLAWLNGALRRDRSIEFQAHTPLFATGLIDSMSILKLIAWTERAIGRRISDDQIRMDNFHSVQRIAEVFVARCSHVDV
jgi:acyl carrier protein